MPDSVELEVVGTAVALVDGRLDDEVEDRVVVVVVVRLNTPKEKSSQMAENSGKRKIKIKTR